MRSAGLAVLAFICVGCVLGCARGYRVDTHIADDGATVHSMLGNEIEVSGGESMPVGHGEATGAPGEGAAPRPRVGDGAPEGTGSRCFLDVQIYHGSAGNVSYRLLLVCIVPEPLDMETAQSLTLIVNQESAVLSGEGDVRREKDAATGFVTESLHYRVSPGFLHRMAEAKTVRLFVSGRSGALDGHFTHNNLANFKRFVEDYVTDW